MSAERYLFNLGGTLVKLDKNKKKKGGTAQHKTDCRFEKYNKNNKIALALYHFKNEGNNFQFNKSEILDLENNFMMRNISEMVFIKVLDLMNFRMNTQCLSIVYTVYYTVI